MRQKEKLIGLKISEKLLSVLSKEILEDLACSTGFVKQLDKLNGYDFCMLQLNSIGSSGFSSLTEQCSQLFQDHGVSLSPQGLSKRYSPRSSKFLKQVLDRVLGIRLLRSSVFPQFSLFSKLIIRDATSSQLSGQLSGLFKGSSGSASKAGIKLDFQYDLFSEEMALEFRSMASSDSTSIPFDVTKEALYLQDLGYWKLSCFAHIKEQGGYFISRYKQGTYVYNVAGKKQSLLQLAKGLKPNQIREFKLELGANQRLPVRLVIQKLPIGVIRQRQKALRKKRQKKGKSPSKHALLMCSITVLITNVSKEQCSSIEIMLLYRLRWQIELIFKAWKSIFKFGKIQAMGEQRFLTMLYGFFAWVILNSKLVQCFKHVIWDKLGLELSELKAFKILYQRTRHLWHAIFKQNSQQLLDILLIAADAIRLFAKKERKKHRLSPFETIF